MPESHGPPSPAPARQVLFGLPPAGRRWPGATRAAFAMGIPALAAVALGYPQQALTVTIGAFAVIYGEGRPYRARWKVVALAALALAAASWAGGLVGEPVRDAIADGESPALLMWVVLVMSAVAVVGTYTVDALRLGPPGVWFIVLTTQIGALNVQSGMSPTGIALWCALGGASAVAVSMVGALRTPHGPEVAAAAAATTAIDDYVARQAAGRGSPALRHRAAQLLQVAWQSLYDGGLVARGHLLVEVLAAAQVRLSGAIRRDPGLDPDSDLDDVRPQPPMPRPGVRYRFLRALHPDSHAWTAATRVLVACLVAGGVTVAIGTDRPDWAVITAVLVLHQGPDRILGTYRGIHRVAGTVVGVLVFAVLFSLHLSGVWLVLTVMALQLLFELFVSRNYGVAVVFITPLAILIGNTGQPHAAVAPVVWERLVETAIGVTVALVVLWTVDRRAHRRVLRWTDRRVALFTGLTLQALRAPADDDALLPLRRDLTFELHSSSLAGIDAAHNEPAWAAAHWPAHTDLHHLGFDVLAGCWSAAAGRPPHDDEITGWERRLAEFARNG
ncbi:FUSC family protein [Rhodococcus kronopolitis]|uniref:FUSC family protein n=1 Tax=Rhodococcus kronopolitis TaxID=1460226 RepID=A0ABV9G077_9NOCA